MQHRWLRPVGAFGFCGVPVPKALPQAITFCPFGAESHICNAVDGKARGGIVS